MNIFFDQPSYLLWFFTVSNSKEIDTGSKSYSTSINITKFSNLNPTEEFILSVDLNRRRAISMAYFKKALRDCLKNSRDKND